MTTPNLVLGLGGTVDYEVEWDSAVLEALVTRYGIRRDELSTSGPIGDERDLVRSVLAFARDGVGGERFVASSDIVETFAARFPKKVTLGGTCVRAALAMTTLGVRSTVHLVSIDDHVRGLLPAEIGYVCSATRDSTDPHLIVQYPAGARVTAGDVDLVAPRANRLIYVNDLPNRELRLSPQLGGLLADADIFLVSGFNTIQDPALLEARLDDLVRHMRSLPAHAVVVYEDGGFHVPAYSRRVRQALADHVDVFGMNEDELQGYLGRRLDLLDVDDVARALDDLQRMFPARTHVIHTAYWALALGQDAEAYRNALDGGVTMASTRYVHGDRFTAAEYERVARGPRHASGVAVSEILQARSPGTVACVPALVLTTDSPTTIGLGDSFVGGFLAALASGRPAGTHAAGSAPSAGAGLHRPPVRTGGA